MNLRFGFFCGVWKLFLIAGCQAGGPFGKEIPLSYRLVNEKKELHLGDSLPQTQSLSSIGQDFLYGMNLVFKKLNSKGGINGTLIKFSTLDDRYDPSVSVKNVKELISNSPILFGLFGSESFASILDQVKNRQIVTIFPFIGDLTFRKKAPRYLINLRASLRCELRALVGYAVEKMRRSKIAVFYESGRWGEGAENEVERLLKLYGLSIQAKGSYSQNTVNVSKAVGEIVRGDPDAIICIAHSRPAYDFIKQIFSGTEHSGGLQNCLFMGVGEMAPMQDIIDDARGIKLVLSSVVPSPWKSKLEIVKRFRKDAKRYLPNRQISQAMLEGYLAASVFTAACKRLGPLMTLEALLKQLESLLSVNFGGIRLRFDERERTLCHDVWLNVGIDKQWPRVKTERE